MPSQLKNLNSNLSRKINFLYLALGLFPAVAFLFLTLAPTPSEFTASALTNTTTMSVGVDESLSLRIVEYNEETGEWDIDTNEISTSVVHGDFASAAVKVIASTNGLGGYTLSLSDINNDTSLTSLNTTDTIPTLNDSVTLDNPTDTTEKFPEEKWGYSWAKNDATSLTFNPIPPNNASASAKQKDSTTEGGSNSYTFTLGVRVSTDTTAETYSDQIMFTLVGNPAPSAPLFFRIQYMQQFTPQICDTVKTPLAATTAVTADTGSDYSYSGDYATKVPSTTIKDQRDEQVYTIRKLADGNCWMTSNLRLGKLGAVNLTPADSNVRDSSFTVPAATTVAGPSWGNQAEYPFVFYRDGNPNSTSPSGIVANSPSGLYNWYTATAGARSSTDSTDGALMTATGGQASDSVCPKNWQLPVNGGTSTDRSYGKLVYLYTGATGNSSATDGTEQGEINETRIEQLIQAPTSFVYSDRYYYGGTLDSRPLGFYWSSSVHSATNSYHLDFNTSGTTRNLYPQGNGYKGNAFAVRCVVAPAA